MARHPHRLKLDCSDGQQNAPRLSERARQLVEDRQVGVQLHAIQPTDAEWRERPLVLEASKLALNGRAATVELLEPLRLARDQRVQTAGLDPHGRGLALARRAAPFARAGLVVGSGERPLAVLARRRLVVAV